jgi:quercetin dioxygenase-like cupin family protein
LIILLSCEKKELVVIKIEKLAETSKSWNGDPLPNYLVGTPKITVMKFTIPPKTKMKWHKHLVINSGIILKGELTVVDDDNSILELKEGDVIVELVNKYHYGENKGDIPVEIVVFYSGTVDVPITVLKEGEAH